MIIWIQELSIPQEKQFVWLKLETVESSKYRKASTYTFDFECEL